MSPIALGAPATPPSPAGVPFSARVFGRGGSGPYSVYALSALPAGVSLSADGTLSGTLPASYDFTLGSTDAQGRRGQLRFYLPASGPRLLTAADIIYLGSFRLPTTGSGCSVFSYAGGWYGNPGNIGYRPQGSGGAGSLLIGGASDGAGGCGASSAPLIAEVSVPTLSTSATYASLNQASLLQSPTFGDVTGGLGTLANLTAAAGTHVAVGGLWVDPVSGYLYWSLYSNYDTGPTYSSHGYATSPGTLSTPDAHGTYKLDDSAGALIRGTAGYTADIPNDAYGNWQARFGNYKNFCGMAGSAILGNEGNGPGMTCFNAADLVGLANASGSPPTVQSAPAKSYLWYPNSNPHPLWDEVAYTTQIGGACFVSSAAVYGILYLGEQALTRSWYGYGNYACWFASSGDGTWDGGNIPPLLPGKSHYSAFGSASGWPATDTEHRYWWTTVPGCTESQLSGQPSFKGNQMDGVAGRWWVCDPNTVADNVNVSARPPYYLTTANSGTPVDSGATFDSTTGSPANSYATTDQWMPLGLAYDRAGKRIFVMQGRRNYPDPVVHVYSHP